MNENELATKIIGVAMDVHTKLGPGGCLQRMFVL
jgi:hypothetical protein